MTEHTKPWLPQSFEEATEAALRLEGPLAGRLITYDRWLRHLDPGWAAAYDRLIAHQIAGMAGVSAPEVGDRLAEFLLPSETGHLIALQHLLQSGPVVISFNRGHWCDFCNIELRALAEITPGIVAAGAQIVAITPDLPQYCRPFRERQSLPFPLLTDLDNAYGLSIGLATTLGHEAHALWQGSGVDIGAFQGNEGLCVPIPATFVVATDGSIAARTVDPDFRRRMDVDEILMTLRGLIPAGTRTDLAGTDR